MNNSKKLFILGVFAVVGQCFAVSKPVVDVAEELGSAPLYIFDSKKHPENFWMSNYYSAPVKLTIGGQEYQFASARAAFEAGFYAPPYAPEVNKAKIMALAAAPDAYKAAELGEKNPCPECFKFKNGRRPIILDWMRKVVRAKYEQHPDLLERLIATGDAPIIEDCEDMFWGAAKGGQNWFGRVTMEVRDEFAHKKPLKKGGKHAKKKHYSY